MRLVDLVDPFRPVDTNPPRTLWAFIRWTLSGAWPLLIFAAVVSGAAGALEAGSAWVLGKVVDSAVTLGPDLFFSPDNLTLILGAMAFFMLLRPALFGLAAMSNNYLVTPNIPPLVLSRLNRWTLGQSVSFFDNDFAGRIAQKQMQTANAMANAVSETISAVVFALASLFASLALLGSIHPLAMAPFAIWLILYFFLIRWFLPRVRVKSAQRAGARAMVSGQVVDTITNIKTVKLFALARQEDDAARLAMGDLREKALGFGKLTASFRASLMVLAGLLPVLLVGITLWLWRLGLATPGDVVASGGISIRIAQMTGWVSYTMMTIYSNIGEIENGMHTLTPPYDLIDVPGAKELIVPRGEIKFQDVSFAYGRKVGGIDGINLTIMPGEKIGIVGASGAGKSTLVSLLLRLYDAESGKILIDGQDISGVTQESLRSQIGMVTQETAMFNRSARDNIRYGSPKASDADVVRAAQQAAAHNFVNDLEDLTGRIGYEAHLGERGVRLSGGQRQRIALARAILKDAPILVLDEATSALDSQVEAQIQAAFERVMSGKTVLAIAHRLSTIAHMDRIIVLDQGRIVEEGTHTDLLARGGLYAEFWSHQSDGFICVDEAAE